MKSQRRSAGQCPRFGIPGVCGPSCRLALDRLMGLGEFSAKTRSRLRAGWRVGRYLAGDSLFHQGNEPLGLFFLCAGAVKLTRSETGGRQHIVRIVGAPEMLGERALIAREPYEASAQVVEDAGVWLLDLVRFESLWRDEPDVARALAARLARRLGETQALLAELGSRTVRERLARVILRCAEGAGRTDLPGSRQELAELIGTAPEVVSRTLAELERKGLCSVDGRRVDILDEARLRAVARLPAEDAARDDFRHSGGCQASSRPGHLLSNNRHASDMHKS